MTALSAVNNVLQFPMEKTGLLNEKIKRSELEEATIGQHIGCRCLMALQLIASLIALPIIAVVGLLEACLYRSFKGEFTLALKEMVNTLAAHTLVGIPTGFMGTFTSPVVTMDIFKARMDHLDECIFDLSPPTPPPAPSSQEPIALWDEGTPALAGAQVLPNGLRENHF